MAKKPILTDDELDGGLPSGDDAPAPPPPPPLPPRGDASKTRPLDAGGDDNSGAKTRIVEDGDSAVPAPPPPPPAPPGQGRDASGHARPKTRIHGYGGDPQQAGDEAAMGKEMMAMQPVVGWLVVIAGPGRGASVALSLGMNSVGRGPDNAAQVDFGDETISRDPHAFVTYDDETRMFHISHGGKTNIVRLNDAPVLHSETLKHGDTIRIGATSLRFVAFCGDDFDWSDA